MFEYPMGDVGWGSFHGLNGRAKVVIGNALESGSCESLVMSCGELESASGM